jgi:hypothetical protein
MKKILFFILIWVCNNTQIFCQSITDAQKYFDEGRIVEAKQQIDEYLNTNSNDVNGLLLKSKIYYVLGTGKQYAEVVADGKAISINALKTANSIDSKIVFTYLQQESFGLPINLYNDLSNDGIVYFNSAAERKGKALYEQALTQFKKAISFSNYIFEQGWGLQPLDSNNLLYATKAAIYANKNEDALLYAKKIVDNNIVKTIENKEFQPVYEWLTYYYRLAKNEELLLKYSQIGSSHFANTAYFFLNKIDWYRANKNHPQLIKEYNTLFTKGFKTQQYYNNYFNDVFAIIFAQKDSMIDRQYYKNVFEKDITDYLNKNKNAFATMLLAGKFYRNLAIEYSKPNKNTSKTVIDLCKNLSKKYLAQIVNNKLAAKDKVVYNEAKKLLK